jgi:N-acetylmuramic acid 6-phosphate etherase
MSFERITEADSHYRHIEKMKVGEILHNINQEDQGVAVAVQIALPSIEKLVNAITDKLLAGGRLFYIGAGTSGRLAIADASECPPTFGVPADLVIGIIAGGEKAITRAVEFAEDDTDQGWKDLKEKKIGNADIVVGISASGTAPYVLHALEACKKNHILTGSITCNPGAPINHLADFPISVAVGPEFITGSTRMKAGTAQKLILNMISTTVMIQLGRVEDNRMVDMQLNNEKLIARGVNMVMKTLKIDNPEIAKALLLRSGSVREAIRNYQP